VVLYVCITGAFIFVVTNEGDLFSDIIVLFMACLYPCKAPVEIIPFVTTRKLLMNFYEFFYFGVLLKFVDICQFWLKLDKHNGHITWRLMCVSAPVSSIIR
jgi:hypothetical protein